MAPESAEQLRRAVQIPHMLLEVVRARERLTTHRTDIIHIGDSHASGVRLVSAPVVSVHVPLLSSSFPASWIRLTLDRFVVGLHMLAGVRTRLATGNAHDLG